jgi:hypothetical protein
MDVIRHYHVCFEIAILELRRAIEYRGFDCICDCFLSVPDTGAQPESYRDNDQSKQTPGRRSICQAADNARAEGFRAGEK